LVESVEVATYKDAVNLFQKSLERGEEGTVIKSLNEVWKDGKSWYQLKMKIEMELDLKVVGFSEGSKGTKYEGTLGAFLVETEDGLLKTACGSGLKEKDGVRDEVWQNQDKYLGSIITVKCNGLSKNSAGGNSLYFPVFIELRPDKNNANTFKECQDIEDMKKALS
jgi:ATP-dependent DNA ligase